MASQPGVVQPSLEAGDVLGGRVPQRGANRSGVDAGIRGLTWDTWLYLLGAAIAGTAAISDRIPIQRSWGRIAFGPYLAAALAAAALAVAARAAGRSVRPRRTERIRAVLLVAVIAGVAIVPLCLEIGWRATEGLRGHVQSEVLVTEASADAVLSGEDPYAASFTEGELGAWPAGTAEHVPYLPGMFAFGVPRALSVAGAGTDARLAFTGVALLALAEALARSDRTVHRKITAMVIIVALPTGARYLVGGGDDLAVLSLMLLSLVLLEERRPWWAGVVAAFAAAMKLTAWPLLPFLVIAARDRDGRRATGRCLGAIAVVVIPVVLPFVLWNPRAFVEDVVLFPLGIAKDPTLAASPTLGSLMAHALPVGKGVLAATLMLVVLVVGTYLSVIRPPIDARGAAERSALVLLLAITLATAGRFGYLLYPIGLLAWARLILVPGRPAICVSVSHRSQPAWTA